MLLLVNFNKVLNHEMRNYSDILMPLVCGILYC